MDHYKALGLNRNASKEEIKEAFRKLAMQFHPDKHSHSPKSVRDTATVRFKQASEAYEVLMDDRKRADYNIHSSSARRGAGGFNSYTGYGYSRPNASYNYSRSAASTDGSFSKFEIAIRFLTTRSFLLNLAFASALLGGTIIIDTGREALWKMYNPGKSFEDAMQSVEKAKAVKEQT
ncbi:hypothetical protein NMG60_11031129 [Bertholletia excelsa]